LIEHVLVYGTLRPGHGAYQAFDLAHQSEHLQTVRVEGTMYDLGSFPGVKLDGNPDGFVCDLLKITNPDVLRRLDAYEGYRPDFPNNSLYLRQTVEVADIGAAYIYEYNDSVGARPRVSSGDWTQWKANG